MSKAPTRKEVEIAVLREADPYWDGDPYSPPETTEGDIAVYIDLDVYEKFASDGSLQEFIREHIANHVGGHTSASDENSSIQSCFYRMLEVMRDYQSEIQFAGGPAIEKSTILGDDSRKGETTTEEEHRNERMAYDLRVSDCEKIIDKPYFTPDSWVANENELSPVIVNRGLEQIPQRILERIYEIHRSFIFGNWMSVIALSRCLLEYAIIDKKGLLEIEIYRNPDKSGKVWRKPLAELAADAKETVPELGNSMERIIEAGNSVMHPSPRGIISKFPPGKVDAKNCIDAITEIISTLYSKPKNSRNPLIKPTTNTRQ